MGTVTCPECDRYFTVNGDESVCPWCSKDKYDASYSGPDALDLLLEAEQKRVDTVAAELLADVDLSGLEPGEGGNG